MPTTRIPASDSPPVQLAALAPSREVPKTTKQDPGSDQERFLMENGPFGPVNTKIPRHILKTLVLDDQPISLPGRFLPDGRFKWHTGLDDNSPSALTYWDLRVIKRFFPEDWDSIVSKLLKNPANQGLLSNFTENARVQREKSVQRVERGPSVGPKAVQPQEPPNRGQAPTALSPPAAPPALGFPTSSGTQNSNPFLNLLKSLLGGN